MSKNVNHTKFWKCSCNKKNSLVIRKCPNCNTEIPNNVLRTVYKEEINRLNSTYEKEEKKRKIVLLIIAIVILQLLSTNFVQLMIFMGILLLFLLLLLGILAGVFYLGLTIRCVLERSDYSSNRNKIRMVYIIMIIAFALVLILSNRWDGFVKGFMNMVSVTSIIMGVVSVLVENKSMLNSIMIKTIVMMVLIVLF